MATGGDRKCLQECSTAKAIYTTKESGDWHRIGMCGYYDNENANFLNTFQLERGREQSLRARVTDANASYIDINNVKRLYKKKGYTICI